MAKEKDDCATGTCPNKNAGGGKERCKFHHLKPADRPLLPRCTCRVVNDEHSKSCSWREAVAKHG